ncbi:MAG: hypothetical protein AB1725_12485 [Armatimonadota bacterium]
MAVKTYALLLVALAVCGVVIALGVVMWMQGRGSKVDGQEPRQAKLILLSGGCSHVKATLGDQHFRWSWLDDWWTVSAEPGRYPLVVTTDRGSASAVVHLDASMRGAEIYIYVDCQSSPPQLDATDLGIKVPLR